MIEMEEESAAGREMTLAITITITVYLFLNVLWLVTDESGTLHAGFRRIFGDDGTILAVFPLIYVTVSPFIYLLVRAMIRPCLAEGGLTVDSATKNPEHPLSFLLLCFHHLRFLWSRDQPYPEQLERILLCLPEPVKEKPKEPTPPSSEPEEEEETESEYEEEGEEEVYYEDVEAAVRVRESTVEAFAIPPIDPPPWEILGPLASMRRSARPPNTPSGAPLTVRSKWAGKSRHEHAQRQSAKLLRRERRRKADQHGPGGRPQVEIQTVELVLEGGQRRRSPSRKRAMPDAKAHHISSQLAYPGYARQQPPKLPLPSHLPPPTPERISSARSWVLQHRTRPWAV